MRPCSPQRGAVMIFALVMLLPLTLVAMVAMQSSNQDLKMAGASADRQQVDHQLDGVISALVQQPGLAATLSTMPANTSVGVNGTQVSIQLNTETSCRRKFKGNSHTAVPSCRYVHARASTAYGRLAQPLTLHAGLEQPLLK